MGQALYRKYRSKNFGEVVGQDHITKTLEHAIKSGKISHAYLFTGPRGVGKTSVARILAHEVNGLPYDDDSMHLDIIEIDAASNRRIDEIRELRDKVHVTPAAAKYKVYIIDEVHMLTREAFNALLKTLEEPPPHAIFILATTEVHKLPETIVSRTQRFTFKPFEQNVAVKLLTDLAKKEKINITGSALELVAQHGQGSFRDSISLLDQLSNSKEEISQDTVRKLLGLPPSSAVEELAASTENGQTAELLNRLGSLFDQGMNATAIAKELSFQLRAKLLAGQSAPWVAPLLRELLNVGASNMPRDYLEITLLEATARNSSVEPTESSLKTPRVPPTLKPRRAGLPLQAPPVVLPALRERVLPTASPAAVLRSEVIEEAKTQSFNIDLWPQIVAFAKDHNASLYTALRLCKPEFAAGTLTLSFEFPLHQKKLDKAAQKNLIGQIIEKQFGAKVKIECVVNKEIFKSAPKDKTLKPKHTPEKETAAPLNSISNIFGNVEMLK